MTDEPYLGSPDDLALLDAQRDVQAERAKTELARREWLATVDAIADPVMVHDGEGRIVRTNKAYAELAGIGLRELIGRKYWECFPLRGGPMTGCQGGHCADGRHPEEFAVGGRAIYTSRASRLGSRSDGAQVLHLFRDITDERALARRAIAQAGALEAISGSGALQAGDLHVVARELTEAVSAACEVARVNVWLFSEDEKELVCVDHYDAALRAHSSGMLLRQAEFENEFRALKTAPYMAADDPLTDPRTAGYVETYLKPNRITSMLDAVVAVSGRHIGVLCLEHVDQPHQWQPDEIAFAQQAAERIALAVSNRRARQAEAALRESEQYFRSLFEHAPVGIAEQDAGGRYLRVNPKLCEITGYAAEELLRHSFHDLTHPGDKAAGAAGLARLLAGEIPSYTAEKRYLRKDGSLLWAAVHVTPLDGAMGERTRLLAIVQDITERRRSEEQLRRSEARFRGFFDLGLIGMAITMPDKGFAEVNGELCRILGYPEDELLRQDWASLTHPEDLAADRQQFERVMAGAIDHYVLDKRFVRKDGGIVFATISVNCMRRADRSAEYFMVLVQDITARRQANMALRASRDLLGRVVENVPTRIFWKDAQLRYLGCNSAFARDAGFATPRDLVGKDDFQLAWREHAERYRADDRAVIDANAPKLQYEEPQTTAEGRTLWLRTSKVPLHDADGRTVGLLGIYEDITERKAADQKLRAALVETVQAMAATMEARDPYTAGHQRRVADLAAAIAGEMGLPEDTVQGIHFGALIHDLGKIQVPAELLAKPTRLSKLEFELIKAHPQAGYEIVKNIRFPWRVAEMVHQHHERLDGSGYPQGLKGEAIALEARILAVADVMEAISSHRPYRPARGVDVALRELESKRGIEFDAAAVDACLLLFRDKGYDLDRGHAGERG